MNRTPFSNAYSEKNLFMKILDTPFQIANVTKPQVRQTKHKLSQTRLKVRQTKHQLRQPKDHMHQPKFQEKQVDMFDVLYTCVV